MAHQARHLRRAVQYLRMSTEHQRYSLENQQAAIAEYAAAKGYEVIRTYADAGKSGLQLKGRKALQSLLSDSLNPDRDFGAILVLDVSRWGRFQDPDQAAYYEYVCRQAGVHVAYVGETFENDGGLVSTIVKHLKRVMAAEYSRELSAKVTRAKLQQARLGFRQGGAVSYGFRRELIEEGGAARRVLKPGQLKGLHTDRVRTIPGPAEEQEVIRRIFQLFVKDGGSFNGVARQLNDEDIPTGSGRPWRPKRIAYIIRNELCLGTYTYNKTNRSMRAPLQPRSKDQWVRVKVAAPVVSRPLFEKANRLAGGARHRYTDKEMLNRLARLLKTKGHLSPSLINSANDTPDYMTYVHRFGSIAHAYELVGFRHPGRRKWRPEIQGFWTDDAMLDAVRRLHGEQGHVSAKLLSDDPRTPSPTLIALRFGGLLPFYAAAGLGVTQGELVRGGMKRRTYRTKRKPVGLQS